MFDWRDKLPQDPISILLDSGSESAFYFVRRDLRNEDPGPVQRLWELPEAGRILRRQLRSGGWKYPSYAAGARSAENYN